MLREVLEELLLLFLEERCDGADAEADFMSGLERVAYGADTWGRGRSSKGLTDVRVAEGGGLSPWERSASIAKLSISSLT